MSLAEMIVSLAGGALFCVVMILQVLLPLHEVTVERDGMTEEGPAREPKDTKVA